VWQVLKNFRMLNKRWSSKKVVSKPRGEIWMQGGLLAFDHHGELRLVMHEKFGELYDVDALDAVVNEINDEIKLSRGNLSSKGSESTESSTSSPEMDN
jgi:hypothetical protein